MSVNRTTPKNLLKETEDKIVTRGQEQLPYQVQVATEAGIERKRQPQTFIPSPVSSTGLISATLLRSRIVRDAYEKQAKFFSLLEEKYGAVKGDDRSYLEAMDRYHRDKDIKKQESKAKTPFEKLEELRLNQEKKAMKREEERMRREEEERMRREEEQRHQREYDERMRQEQYRQYHQQPGWEQWNRHEERRKQQEWERFKQQQQQKPQQQYQQYQQRSYAYGGPAPEPGPLPSSRDKGDDRYPSPHSREEALVIMGIDPHASITSRDIKLAFNKKALLLHPDKNLHNPDEAGEKFKQLDAAFKYLKKQEGGRSRKRRSMSSRKNKRKLFRKTSRKTSRKYYKKTHKK
jgi:hypothetical protein